MKKFTALFVIAIGFGRFALGSEELMTRGKIAADLGDQTAAAKAFSAVAQDPKTVAGERAEALVRLGAVLRAQNQSEASAATFQKALESPGRDARSTRLLALAVTGVAPAGERLNAAWPKVRLAVAASHSDLTLHWPGDGPVGVRQALPEREPVTMDLDDAPLTTFLCHFLAGAPAEDASRIPGWPGSYRPPASVRGLDFVIHSGVSGQVSVKAAGMPWNELLENVLASYGLGLERQGNRLVIARAADLDAFVRHRGRHYDGLRVSYMMVGFEGASQGCFSVFADSIGQHLLPDADVRCRLAMNLSDTPAPEALDLILMANDLAATRLDANGSRLPDGTLRICRRAEAKDDVDLSQPELARPPLRPLVGRVLQSEFTLFALPLNGNQGVPSGKPRFVTLDPNVQLAIPCVHGLSADGRFLAFPARSGSGTAVRLKDLQTGHETRVAEGRFVMAALVSPDGRDVIYDLGSDVQSAPTAGGAPKMLYRGVPFLGLSPDGRFMLAWAPNDRSSLLVIELASGKRAEVVKHAQRFLDGPRFSPDGRWIAFHDGLRRVDGKGGVFVARFAGLSPIAESEWIPITGDTDWANSPAWSPDGNLLYCFAERDGSRGIWAQRLDAGKHPAGKPFVVLPLSDAVKEAAWNPMIPAHPMGVEPFGQLVFWVGADKLVYGLATEEPGPQEAARR
jgi:hypothetical protein